RAVWALTDRRSALVEVSAPETSASESESLLSHAHRMGAEPLGTGATVRNGRGNRGRRARFAGRAIVAGVAAVDRRGVRSDWPQARSEAQEQHLPLPEDPV